MTEVQTRKGLWTAQALVAAVLETDGQGYGVENWAADYAEPGYHTPEKGILFGNWNTRTRWNKETNTSEVIDKRPARFAAIAEHIGYELEWSDEWSTCEDCGKAVRTSADSYSWTPSYAIVNECTILCADCLANDPQDYLDELNGNDQACLTVDMHAHIDLSAYGYHKFNADRYESGFHPGQTDNPREIAKQLRKQGIEDFIFVQAEQSQFYIKFDVYVKESNEDEDN
jgi:hypothetical protein